jgi:branched-chain amino acid transport system ATP-binding protein
MPLLELKNISSAYGSVEALRGVSLHVDRGEVVTLLGANGAGKSTTLRTISGLIKPTSGEIWFEGQRIDTLAPEQIVRMGISHVPEGRRIFPGLTVKENIMLGSTARGHLSKQAIADALGWTLSGGQQQMLAVARGLMAKPKLLLLDEPSLGLAPVIVQQLFATIREIHDRGTTILLVEQNAHMALSVAARGYVLETGSMTVEGTTSQLLDNEEVRAAYLGGHVA